MTAGLVARHPSGADADGHPGRPERADEDRDVLARLVAGLRTIDANDEDLVTTTERSGDLAPTEVVAVVELALGAAMRRLDAEADLEQARTRLVAAGALPTVAALLERVGADRATIRRATGGALGPSEDLLELPDERLREIAHQLGWLDDVDRRDPSPGFDGFWQEQATEPPMRRRLRRWARGDAPGSRP